MLYESAADWRNADQKRVLFFGMSGLGKTHVSNTLRDAGSWFHYSIDYRIGTRYMGEYIADNAKAHAMQVPFLRDLLMSDSIFIGSNISFSNLAPVSTYLGKPGDPTRGGMEMTEYTRRQEQFRQAEISALLDTGYFIERAQALYGYRDFICDTGGSICEWVNPEDPNDTILKTLSSQTLMIWIKGSDAHTQELIRRFNRAPKPMAYQPQFLARCWADYLAEKSCPEAAVDPDDFIRWTYGRALAHRQPLYQAMARNWGVTVTAEEIAAVTDQASFDNLVAQAIDRRG
ncbi:ATPase [Marinovum sp. 2_MG-2023]|uniref:ATPase n=1 Tax=unclassified Marinovum TaxID=2647166 RepID=UPI0026E37BFE|nr:MULTISPECIES: ATPase [unclassified Marinovum]MDO6729515.1 ATPase [Marinovum sp. 2_MG-2023]MDO6780331.1 ATPase [Marinovum sp. 1_MG-2023]